MSARRGPEWPVPKEINRDVDNEKLLRKELDKWSENAKTNHKIAQNE